MDKTGNIAVGYSASSSTVAPSIRYTGRQPTDPLGTLSGEQVVITSGGSVAEAVDTFRKAVEKWRSQNPVEVKNYTAWAAQ